MALRRWLMVKSVHPQFWLFALGLCLALFQLPLSKANTTPRDNTPIKANTTIRANATGMANTTVKSNTIEKATTLDSCGSYATCNIKDAVQVCYLDDQNSCIRKYPSECHLRVDLCHMKQPVPEFNNDMCSMDTYYCEIGYERWTIFFGHEND